MNCVPTNFFFAALFCCVPLFAQADIGKICVDTGDEDRVCLDVSRVLNNMPFYIRQDVARQLIFEFPEIENEDSMISLEEWRSTLARIASNAYITCDRGFNFGPSERFFIFENRLYNELGVSDVISVTLLATLEMATPPDYLISFQQEVDDAIMIALSGEHAGSVPIWFSNGGADSYSSGSLMIMDPSVGPIRRLVCNYFDTGGTSVELPAGPDNTSFAFYRFSTEQPSIEIGPDNHISFGEDVVEVLASASELDWDATSDGDLSCFVPKNVDVRAVSPTVNYVRIHSVLISGVDRGFVDADGQLRVRSGVKCESPNTAHCTGFLESDGASVLTAYHCVFQFMGSQLETGPIEIGASAPCTSEDKIRFVSAPVAASHFDIPDYGVARCESIMRLSNDIVRVKLDQQLPTAPSIPGNVQQVRLPEVGEIENLLVDGRRLYATGYMQVAELRDIPGGIVLPVRFCSVALAGKLGRFVADSEETVNELVAELSSGQLFDASGYGCTSLDTMNGASGGPVFSVSDNSEDLVLIGFVVAAAHTGWTVECQPNVLEDSCSNRAAGVRSNWYNLFERLPETYISTLRQ